MVTIRPIYCGFYLSVNFLKAVEIKAVTTGKLSCFLVD